MRRIGGALCPAGPPRLDQCDCLGHARLDGERARIEQGSIGGHRQRGGGAGAVAGVAGAGVLGASALRDEAAYFRTPEEIKAGKAIIGAVERVVLKRMGMAR